MQLWITTIMNKHGLVNIFGDDDQQRTYVNDTTETWPDHTLVSSTLWDADMVRAPRVLSRWKRQGPDKGVMHSVHVPTIVQINIAAWLDRNTVTVPETMRHNPVPAKLRRLEKS